MIQLTVEQVLKLHEMMIAKTGGASGTINLGLLDSAVKSTFQTFDGNDIYPTIEEKASRMAFGIVNNHPFADGNKRTGLFAMLVFLELNKIELEFTQTELIHLGLGLAESKITADDTLNWILQHKKRD